MKDPDKERRDPPVRIERAFEAPRDQIFDAWVQPDLLEDWFAPEGCTLQIVRLDVREGGGYHWCINNPSFGECWTIGSYLEVRRPERLVFTATIADADGNPRTPESQGHDTAWPQETTIRVTFVERAGRTVLTLEQDVSERLAKRTGGPSELVADAGSSEAADGRRTSMTGDVAGFAPQGRLVRALRFTIAEDKILELEIIRNPARLGELEVSVAD